MPAIAVAGNNRYTNAKIKAIEIFMEYRFEAMVMASNRGHHFIINRPKQMIF
jgi:hypothetical protein